LRGINISGVTFTGTNMSLNNEMRLLQESSGIVGEFNYGQVQGESYNPKYWEGNYRLGRNYLRYHANRYTLTSGGGKGSHEGWVENYYSVSGTALRLYNNSTNKNLIARVDIQPEKIQIADNWNDVNAGVILNANGSLSASTIEARGTLTAKSNVDISGNTIFRTTTDFQGSSIFRSTMDVQGNAVFRTDLSIGGKFVLGSSADINGSVILRSTLDVQGNSVFRTNLDVNGQLIVGSSMDITGSTVLRSTLDVKGAQVNRSTTDFEGSAIFRSQVEFRGLVDLQNSLKSTFIYNQTTSAAANVYIGGDGYFRRSTSAKKYKEDIQEVNLSDGYAERILNLKPKYWYDKAEVNENGGSYEGLNRYYGLIAEDVVEVGLPEYALFTPPDEEGNREVDGIAYDRLWTLLIPITKKHHDEINLLKLENQYLKQENQKFKQEVSLLRIKINELEALIV
jgi:hypothetical protein